jgi:hypothetical protein
LSLKAMFLLAVGRFDLRLAMQHHSDAEGIAFSI